MYFDQIYNFCLKHFSKFSVFPEINTWKELWHFGNSNTFFRAVVKELVETEEEFGKDLQLVVERYLKPLDNPGVPRIVRDNKEIIFTNLKQIAEFHNTYV